jgi:hypothetical protein
MDKEYLNEFYKLAGVKLDESPDIKPVIKKIMTQNEIVKMGGNYNVQHGMLMLIPVDKIDGLDPSPADWHDDEGNVRDFEKGETINKPIEVWYEPDRDVFLLQDGNHRVKQAKLNSDKYIKAFVQADKNTYRKWMMIK